MITDKELEALMRKVDGAVDKQYNFIKEMKDIKNYLWELKATMQENTIEENVTPLVVEPIIAPSIPEAIEEEKVTSPATVEIAEGVVENPIINPQIVEEVTAEETAAIAPQPVEANQPYHSRKPNFEKPVDDW